MRTIFLCVLCLYTTSVIASPLPLSEATRIALERNVDIRLQTQALLASQGQRLQADAPFDWVVTASVSHTQDDTPLAHRDALASGLTSVNSNTTSYDVSTQRLLPQGWTVGANVQAQSTDETSYQLQGIPRQNLLSIGLNVNIPLLRGRNGDSVMAVREASELNVLAAQYNLQARTTDVLYELFMAYWQYVANEQLLMVANDAVLRSQKLMNNVERLIAADELPKADIVLLKATHADRVYGQVAAQQTRDQARDKLGQIMGLSVDEVLNLGVASDTLPVWRGDYASLQQLQYRYADFIRLAQQQKPELFALQAQQTANHYLLKAAKDRLRPQLDFQLSSAYKRLSESGDHVGFITESWYQGAGPSVSAALRYEIPISSAAR